MLYVYAILLGVAAMWSLLVYLSDHQNESSLHFIAFILALGFLGLLLK